MPLKKNAILRPITYISDYHATGRKTLPLTALKLMFFTVKKQNYHGVLNLTFIFSGYAMKNIHKLIQRLLYRLPCPPPIALGVYR